MILGILLLVVGGVFFLKNLGLITLGAWQVIWPIFLIAIGAYILYKRHRIMVWKERIWRKLE